MANEVITKYKSIPTPASTNITDATSVEEPKKRIMLPWIPYVSPKLKSVYKKADYDVAFKSGKNSGSLLSLKNKSKLPKNSYHGVYQILCACGIPAYRGQTNKRIPTRFGEHSANIEREEVDKSGVALHIKNCPGEIKFDEENTVAIIHKEFQRKKPKNLEIQRQDCHHSFGSMNLVKGQ